MADITDLTQTAGVGDILTHEWINQVKNRFLILDQKVSKLEQDLNTLRSQVSSALKISVLSGFNITVSPGSVKLSDGTVVLIPGSNLTVLSNSIAFVFVNPSGIVEQSVVRPAIAYEIGTVETDANKITKLVNFPSLVVENTTSDLSNYASIDYVDNTIRKAIAFANKTTTFRINSRDTYYTIPFEELSGAGFNTAGIFTAPQDGRYIFNAQIRVDTTSPGTQPDVAAKLSLFDATSELGLPLQQAESARGDLTLNAENVRPLLLYSGQIARIRIYLTEGINCRVREGSRVQVWRLPL